MQTHPSRIKIRSVHLQKLGFEMAPKSSLTPNHLKIPVIPPKSPSNEIKIENHSNPEKKFWATPKIITKPKKLNLDLQNLNISNDETSPNLNIKSTLSSPKKCALSPLYPDKNYSNFNNNKYNGNKTIHYEKNLMNDSNLSMTNSAPKYFGEKSSSLSPKKSNFNNVKMFSPNTIQHEKKFFPSEVMNINDINGSNYLKTLLFK